MGNSRPKPVFYTKIGCLRGDEVREALDRQGIRYDERIVMTSLEEEEAAKIKRISGQTGGSG